MMMMMMMMMMTQMVRSRSIFSKEVEAVGRAEGAEVAKPKQKAVARVRLWRKNLRK